MVIAFRLVRCFSSSGKNEKFIDCSYPVLVALFSFCFEYGDWKFICFSRLEPLLMRIKEKRSAILCPGIDMISEQNMAYGVSNVYIRE